MAAEGPNFSVPVIGCAVTKLALISFGILCEIFSLVLPRSMTVHFSSNTCISFAIAIIPSTGIVKKMISQCFIASNVWTTSSTKPKASACVQCSSLWSRPTK